MTLIKIVFIECGAENLGIGLFTNSFKNIYWSPALCQSLVIGGE